ncbi:hypothetical protein FA13DRAFT_1817065 [Coprinellus micaceus]|uniref:Secreted protein n=1 Tax=Coprinellus micaceus TaxID=71717 RepID=A0A4Y7SWL6_COPMI|nr:hypothetical protein FA13DRAFT_1817065 [Coprinellus micaceus]
MGRLSSGTLIFWSMVIAGHSELALARILFAKNLGRVPGGGGANRSSEPNKFYFTESTLTAEEGGLPLANRMVIHIEHVAKEQSNATADTK